MTSDLPGRLRRLAEELEDEVGEPPDASTPLGRLLLEEIDRARRPHVHERRVVSSGVVVAPASDPSGWASNCMNTMFQNSR